MGHFDASISLGVNDNTTTTVPLQVTVLSPNPADYSAAMNFNSPVNGNVRIDLFNAMGTSVKNVYNDIISMGPHSINCNVADLPSAACIALLRQTGRR